ncbi:MAG: hypothetical protein LUE86_07980, partial [Clostridiales bacterium]|nr:hypothetical protein [Clostridiales bacterium]
MEHITFEEGRIYAKALRLASKFIKRKLNSEDIIDEVLTEFGGPGPDREYTHDVMALLVPILDNYRVFYYTAAEQQKTLIDGKDNMYLGHSLEWYEQERQYFL